MTGPGQSCTSSSRRRASTPLPPGRLVVRRFGCTGTSCTSRTQKGVGNKKKRRRSVNYEVQAAPVIGADGGCCCVRQPLLGDHLPIRRTHGLPSHAHPRTLYALRAIRPVRVQARAWSPKASTSPPQPGGPQRLAHKGSGRRRRRRRAKSIAWGGSAQDGSLGMAVNQAPACGPDCDRRRAQAEGDKEGSSVRSRK